MNGLLVPLMTPFGNNPKTGKPGPVRFNPWWGCLKVSPGCEHCYAERLDARFGETHWGPSAPRRFFGDRHWAEPINWCMAAHKAGERRRVFCSSMADVFEDAPGLEEQRDRLWKLIQITPSLDWLLLTKRPENFEWMLPCLYREYQQDNVWLGVSVEDQRRADERIPILLRTPAAVRFVSVEPLIEPVDVFKPEWNFRRIDTNKPWPRTNWVIVGGESGPPARPCDVDWIRTIMRQCRAASVPCWVKQLGAAPFESPKNKTGVTLAKYRCVPLRDHKGADPAEWPEDLRVQEEVPR